MTVELALTDLGGGDGEVLVLGPSLGTTATGLWSAAAALLTDRFHVVAWDLPGHGGSGPATGFTIADLAAAVLEQVDGPFAYAGVSVGGAVGLQLLLDAPDRVRSAALLSTGARISTPAAWAERADRVRREGLHWLVGATPERWFAPANRDTTAARALVAEFETVDAASYAAVCDALAAFDVRDRLAEIAPPVLAVAGAHDTVAPPASLRHIADGVVDGRLVVVPDAAHQLPVEATETTAQLIRESTAHSNSASADRARADGMRVRREVLGDAHVDRASAAVDGFTADFQEFITRYAWGSIWTRLGLDRRSRSLITLTALVAGGHSEELALHLRGALRNGLTPDEIKECLLQTAIYCGVPAANTAFRIAQQVFAEEQT